LFCPGFMRFYKQCNGDWLENRQLERQWHPNSLNAKENAWPLFDRIRRGHCVLPGGESHS
jgi:hypothetical protein